VRRPLSCQLDPRSLGPCHANGGQPDAEASCRDSYLWENRRMETPSRLRVRGESRRRDRRRPVQRHQRRCQARTGRWDGRRQRTSQRNRRGHRARDEVSAPPGTSRSSSNTGGPIFGARSSSSVPRSSMCKDTCTTRSRITRVAGWARGSFCRRCGSPRPVDVRVGVESDVADSPSRLSALSPSPGGPTRTLWPSG
jgi:hypothetical protein